MSLEVEDNARTTKVNAFHVTFLTELDVPRASVKVKSLAGDPRTHECEGAQ